MTGVSRDRRRVAAWLWILLAVVVWNVVFDRVVVVAGRDFIDLAVAAARSRGPRPKIEDTMRPARSRALLLASASAGVILVVGFVAISATRPRRT